jgi:hypothetical protein
MQPNTEPLNKNFCTAFPPPVKGMKPLQKWRSRTQSRPFSRRKSRWHRQRPASTNFAHLLTKSAALAMNPAVNRLHLAEAALQAARDKEDADAMGRAAALVVQARKEVAVVQDRNSVLLLEADSFVELADKARAELQAAVELLKAAQGNRHEAQLLLLAVEADRHALQALLAHARWVEANDRAEVRRIPSRIDAIGFFFHQSERAPQWEGKGLPVAFTGTQLNQFQGLLWALREPAWNEFDTDPSGIPFDAAAAAAGQ